jgi:hypothetical protein
MFRFTIRDVLWLTVVAALAVGWWVERRSLLDAKREAEADAEDLSRLSDPTVEFAPWRMAELRQKYALPD